MGYGRYTPDDWQTVKRSTAGRTTQQNFTAKTVQAELDPGKITVRESRDSTQNPASTPIIVGCDLTGSMGDLANKMLQEGCGTLTLEMYKRRPVTDPHLLIAGIGDAHVDQAPFQATQFEASADPLVSQIKKIFVEGGGGGNASESYHLTWYFAALKTACDSFAKRGKKGILVTYGDEGVPPALTPSQINQVFGDKAEQSLSAQQLLTMAEREWDVYHLIILEGGHLQGRWAGPGNRDNVVAQWRDLLGERAILVSDYTKMPEIIVSLAQIRAGQDADAVANSWSGSTALVVRDAVGGMKSGQVARTGAAGGVTRL